MRRGARGNGELASEINAEAAAVSNGAGTGADGAGADGVGRSSSNVTMRQSMAAEAPSGTTGAMLAVAAGSTSIEGTGGGKETAEGSLGERPVDVNQLKD